MFTGDYPKEMRERVGSRLPTFTAEQSASLMRAAPHLLGVNHYSSSMVAAVGDGVCMRYRNGSSAFKWRENAHYLDQCLVEFKDPKRTGPLPNPHLKWLSSKPEGMRRVLQWMSRRYAHSMARSGSGIVVAESGVGLDGGSNGDPRDSGTLTVDVNDDAKIEYLSAYWSEAHAAMVHDGVDLRGIFHWSFLDNLEWGSGYSAHFGMVHVDHSDPALPRTPKKSAAWHQKVVEQHGFVPAGGEVELPGL